MGVADELQRVLGALGQLADLAEPRLELAGGALVAASADDPLRPRRLQLGVDLSQIRIQALIVVPEFEELRIREFENVEG